MPHELYNNHSVIYNWGPIPEIKPECTSLHTEIQILQVLNLKIAQFSSSDLLRVQKMIVCVNSHQ